jgi:peptidoglycan/LPS O-acetylase OafA/YrhL
VPGWDLLRGLSAIAVAVYHLLHWSDLASLHAWGSYGVYIFFALSGASLAYTYGESMAAGRFAFGRFLWIRYVRLAPLYLLLMPVMLAMLSWNPQAAGSVQAWVGRIALNASFLFGWFDPATSAILIGGWSLGIEAVYYLLFPLLLRAANVPRAGWLVFLGCVVLQAAWVWATAGGPEGYAANGVRYHQAPAFIAYFMGGCLIGSARRRAAMPTGTANGPLAAIGGGFALLLLLNPAQAGDELLGWRGWGFAALCLLMVGVAGQLRPGACVGKLAAHLGDATYGLYLIHPILFFALSWFVLPQLGLGAPQEWAAGLRIMLVLAVIAAACALALLSERCLERPLREWSKKRFAPRQSEAPSISS